jgi:hypothetical protein
MGISATAVGTHKEAAVYGSGYIAWLARVGNETQHLCGMSVWEFVGYQGFKRDYNNGVTPAKAARNARDWDRGRLSDYVQDKLAGRFD